MREFAEFWIILNTYLFSFLQLLDVSISVFASLVGISIRIASSATGVNICVVTAGIKKYKSINKKREEAWENSIASKI